MKKVPKNNVDPVLVDVKKPDFNYRHASQFSEIDLNRGSQKNRESSSFSFGSLATSLMAFGLLAILLFGGVAFSKFKNTKVTVENQGQEAAQNFFSSIESFQNMNPSKAGESLEKSRENLETINKSLTEGPSRFAFDFLSGVLPVFKQAGGFLQELTSLNVKLIELSSNLEELKLKGFEHFRNNGEKLLSLLNDSRDILREITTHMNTLRNTSSDLSNISQFSKFNNVIQDYHLGYASDLYALEDFLGGLISLLSSDQEKHILLMFQNSSEMRPAGGFIGSYGEIVIKDGEMKDLIVEDIYWPDHEMNFDLKLIPPQPLQRTTKDWGARDANWFLDFPSSAEAVMTLLESSEIYEKNGIRFDGAVALNIEVLQSFLKAVGPIEIEDYDMTVTSENFLPKLQEEVETGIDKQQGKNPKKILSVLAPKLLDKLNNLSGDSQSALVESVGNHVSDKDVMFYSRDNNINSFLEATGVNGSIFDIPSNFWGSYLSVVNANIAGGKTDAFTNQSIDLNLDVMTDGSTVGSLEIKRENNGHTRSESWYNTVNKDFVKVLTPPQSNLIFMEGNTDRGRYSEDYSTDYSYFKTLKPIEESRSYLQTYDAWETNEFGKKGFGSWLITPPGESKTLSLRYESPSMEEFNLEPGKKFEFVFDDQSGVDTSLNVKINAPVGYKWKESGSQVFTKSFDNPMARENIELTIQEK